MTKSKRQLLGPPLIGSWVPYIDGRVYKREVYELFLYDGTILPAMFPSPSPTAPNEVNWTFIGNVFSDAIESHFHLSDEGYHIVPHPYIVAVRLMSDEAIRQHGVIWDVGVTRQENMKDSFLYRTTGRRYNMREVRSIAKAIESAVNNSTKPRCVLNILKISLRDVIDK